MKIAARYPIKSYPWLLSGTLLFHLLILFTSVYFFGFKSSLLLIILSLIASAYFSVKHYNKLTTADDDLCWSGENWLISPQGELKGSIYLTLLPSSWISANLCLLHFSHGKNKYHWLFSRSQLGDQLYSQLIFNLQRDLKSNSR